MTCLRGLSRAISARFDRECNRTLARTVGAKQEFRATDGETVVGCYPIEAVTKFELKTTEAMGWVEQTGVSYLLRAGVYRVADVVPLSFVP